MSLKYFESFTGLWNTNFTFRSLASDFAIRGCGGGDVAARGWGGWGRHTWVHTGAGVFVHKCNYPFKQTSGEARSVLGC